MPATKDIRSKLRERLRLPEQDVERIAQIVERYDLRVTIRNFDDYGLLLKDAKKKTVRILNGDLREYNIHLPDPHADVVIVYTDGLLAGWTDYESLEDLTDRCIINLKSLNPMPQEFVFKQGCEHMSVHGGWTDGEVWHCLECGKQLIFNE